VNREGIVIEIRAGNSLEIERHPSPGAAIENARQMTPPRISQHFHSRTAESHVVHRHQRKLD
jgi:hypothetical protein